MQSKLKSDNLCSKRFYSNILKWRKVSSQDKKNWKSANLSKCIEALNGILDLNQWHISKLISFPVFPWSALKVVPIDRLLDVRRLMSRFMANAIKCSLCGRQKGISTSGLPSKWCFTVFVLFFLKYSIYVILTTFDVSDVDEIRKWKHNQN